MSPLMFDGSAAALLLKHSMNPSKAAGCLFSQTRLPYRPGYYSWRRLTPRCCQYPLNEVSGPTQLGQKVSFAKQAAQVRQGNKYHLFPELCCLAGESLLMEAKGRVVMGTEPLSVDQCSVTEPNRAALMSKMAFSKPLY